MCFSRNASSGKSGFKFLADAAHPTRICTCVWKDSGYLGEKRIKGDHSVVDILIVDDDDADAAIAHGVCAELGWNCARVDSFAAAIDLARSRKFNIMIIDRMLNDGSSDGIDIISVLQKHEISMAFVVASSLGGTLDRVAGLDRGADAYLTKPIHPAELRAQLASIGRRLGYLGGYSPILQCGALEMRLETQHVTLGGKTLKLTDKSYAILKVLVLNAGQPLSKDVLWNECWPDWNRMPVQVKNVEKAIARLREELKSVSPNEIVQNRRGGGYLVPVEIV
jgi:DNA-binding response OmpR family regulator